MGDNTEFMKTLKEAVTKVKPFRLLTEGITRSFHNGIATFLKVKGVNCEYRLSAEAPHVGATILSTNIDTFVKHSDTLTEEIFGPVTLIVQCKNIDELFKGLSVLGKKFFTKLTSFQMDNLLQQFMLNPPINM